MFDPSREQARQFFFDVWRKRQEQAVLSPLEAMGWEIISHHPEYHGVLIDPEQSRDRDWFPEQGESNPFLHLSLHLAVEEQLSIDQPPGIRAAYHELSGRLKDEHAARHRLMECLAEILWQSQRHGLSPDSSSYLALVRSLAR